MPLSERALQVAKELELERDSKFSEEPHVVTSIDLPHADLFSDGARTLGKALAENTALTRLNVVSCKLGALSAMGEEACKVLAEYLTGHASLAVLKLGSNNIGNEGVPHVLAMLSATPTLTVLNLGGNGIAAEGCALIADALRQRQPGTHEQRPQSLKTLSLSRNPIGDVGAAALAAALPWNDTLTSLDLWGCGVDGEGAMAFVECFGQRDVHNTALQSLNLWANPLGGARGAGFLAQMLHDIKAWKSTLKLRIGGYNPSHNPIQRTTEGLPKGYTRALAGNRLAGLAAGEDDAETRASKAKAQQMTWSDDD
jgi:Ran GTPase-activating protein (RanGAP) involved in mRNA processing and transport